MHGDQLWLYWDPVSVKKEMVRVMEFERCVAPGPNSQGNEVTFWRSQAAGEEEYQCSSMLHSLPPPSSKFQFIFP